MITYQGTTYSFQCSEDSWNLYKDVIKAWCDGESVECNSRHLKGGDFKDFWVDVVDVFQEEMLPAYRIKPAEYSKKCPKAGEVWKDPLVDSFFVICKDTDKTGQVFWIEESKISSSGFTYENIVFDYHCEKVYDSLGDYFTAKVEVVT